MFQTLIINTDNREKSHYLYVSLPVVFIGIHGKAFKRFTFSIRR